MHIGTDFRMASLTRRDLVALTSGGLLGQWLGGEATGAPAPSAKEPVASLAALARTKGMRFGSAVGDGPIGSEGSFNDPNYAHLLDVDCNLLVSFNEMKWQALRPADGQFDFASFDRILSRAETRKMAMRGHNLLWQRSKFMPAWVEHYDFGARPALTAERLVREHISTVVGRYRSRIHSFDVVNEAVLPDNGSLTETALSRALGSTTALLDLAFHVAREAAPDAQLVYNDYMSWESGNQIRYLRSSDGHVASEPIGGEAHREGVRRLLTGFRERRVPVDALGVQSHLVAGVGTEERAWRKFLDDVVGMGYTLLITEFDVDDCKLTGDVEARDRGVADAARGYLDLMFSYREVRDVLVWGMYDTNSWLQTFPPLRDDGLPKRPSLYDAAFRPKQLRAAVAAAFASTSVRA
jgi:endo-1,4-beta-xylanase